ALDEQRALVVVQGTDTSSPGEKGAAIDLFGIGGGFVTEVERGRLADVIEAHRASGATVLDADAMQALKVEAARATWGIDFDEHAYVQEAGLATRAVSF